MFIHFIHVIHATENLKDSQEYHNRLVINGAKRKREYFRNIIFMGKIHFKQNKSIHLLQHVKSRQKMFSDYNWKVPKMCHV